MENTVIDILETELNRLQIKYRKLPTRSGAFYYCKMPTNGYTFDLQCDDQGNIQIWKFIGTAPLSKAGNRYEYRDSKDPCAVVGVEVTDEGDVSFFAEQKMDVASCDSDHRIGSMIRGYINIIADSSLTLFL